MPIVDQDTVLIRRATRTGTPQNPTKLEVEMTWTDSAGVVQGTFSSSWADLEALKEFLGSQGYDDVLRAVMVQCIQKSDGSFRPAVFHGLSGKTFQINVRTTQV